MKIDILTYKLDFKFRAITSRDSFTSKDTHIIVLRDTKFPGIIGLGECSPLKGLSPDLQGNIIFVFEQVKAAVQSLERLELDQLRSMITGNYPAILFGLETALMDFLNGGERMIYPNQFVYGNIPIPINGLVWMGEKDEMLKRIDEKIKEGYRCIKIKIGGIEFEDELYLINHIRSNYSEKDLTIRLDANGAFNPKDVFSYLDRLEKFEIHSIEQPIMAGNWNVMQEVCKHSPIPIALDEELIGLLDSDTKRNILDKITPQYIIIKPSLVGGLRESVEWIRLAEQRGIGWWITSALESNVGLNAIAQLTANYEIDIPQGLGTGQLYKNNIPSPLKIEHAKLLYDTNIEWDLKNLNL